MIPYLQKDEIDSTGFGPYDEPGDHIKNRGPDPQTRVRIDWENEVVVAGVFECGPSLLDITQGHNEHSVVLEGEVFITDRSTGTRYHYTRGDGFILEQGDNYEWQVTCPRFRKSFFMIKPGVRVAE